MKIYLVGGAVRDELLGLTVKERDWLVVGATPEDMFRLGYRAVGKNFPVFLHPETHEEYALARTEKKTGRGYKGFHFYASPEVTLEQDLKRRDLTINAMAKSLSGELIDPYGGRLDLEKKILRHVSPAFVEDPVRLLRVARFSARFGDFTIHESTQKLMQGLVSSGEINYLVAERIWKELNQSLSEVYPVRFFEVLRGCGALDVLFPEFSEFIPIQDSLKKITLGSSSPLLRFAGLLSSLMPEYINKICQKLRVPKEYKTLALLVTRQNNHYLEAIQKKNAELTLYLLENVDAFRRPKQFQNFLTVCAALYEPEGSKPIKKQWQYLYQITQQIKPIFFIEQGYTGVQLGHAIHEERRICLKKAFSEGL